MRAYVQLKVLSVLNENEKFWCAGIKYMYTPGLPIDPVGWVQTVNKYRTKGENVNSLY